MSMRRLVAVPQSSEYVMATGDAAAESERLALLESCRDPASIGRLELVANHTTILEGAPWSPPSGAPFQDFINWLAAM